MATQWDRMTTRPCRAAAYSGPWKQVRQGRRLFASLDVSLAADACQCCVSAHPSSPSPISLGTCRRDAYVERR